MELKFKVGDRVNVKRLAKATEPNDVCGPYYHGPGVITEVEPKSLLPYRVVLDNKPSLRPEVDPDPTVLVCSNEIEPLIEA